MPNTTNTNNNLPQTLGLTPLEKNILLTYAITPLNEIIRLYKKFGYMSDEATLSDSIQSLLLIAENKPSDLLKYAASIQATNHNIYASYLMEATTEQDRILSENPNLLERFKKLSEETSTQDDTWTDKDYKDLFLFLVADNLLKNTQIQNESKKHTSNEKSTFLREFVNALFDVMKHGDLLKKNINEIGTNIRSNKYLHILEKLSNDPTLISELYNTTDISSDDLFAMLLVIEFCVANYSKVDPYHEEAYVQENFEFSPNVKALMKQLRELLASSQAERLEERALEANKAARFKITAAVLYTAVVASLAYAGWTLAPTLGLSVLFGSPVAAAAAGVALGLATGALVCRFIVSPLLNVFFGVNNNKAVPTPISEKVATFMAGQKAQSTTVDASAKPAQLFSRNMTRSEPVVTEETINDMRQRPTLG